MPRTIFVTGGSRGIGRAVVERFAKAGEQVFFCYLKNQEAAHHLCETYPNVHAIQGDVTSKEALEKAIRIAGDIDVLIPNAGIAWQGVIQDMKEEEWDHLFSVNVKGSFLAIQVALPGFLHKQKGCIVTVSSMWGITGASCEAAYAASKAAIIGFSKSLAKELAPSGIRVNCVAPGATDTDMLQHLNPQDLIDETPLGRLGTPQDIANAVYFLASEEASFITGQVLSPNGGWVI